MVKHIIITGSSGRIGTVISKGFSHNSEYHFIKINHKDVNFQDYTSLKEYIRKLDVSIDLIIHLAWNTEAGDADLEFTQNPNKVMLKNFLKIAHDFNIPKLIFPSSVHVFDLTKKRSNLITFQDIPDAKTNYGQLKIKLEQLCKHYAKDNLNIYCIRFGGVFKENKPDKDDVLEWNVWLDNKDCVQLIMKILEDSSFSKFQRIVAVSRNKGNPFDLTNDIGWIPEEFFE